ncbi:MAG: NUDIX domain-containing protein [Treponema sp.]|jgi:8-oxo-dGTP diphosphatase|nr:NUDIX domain-containing protein [Treponema sp.]MBQ1643187.1 NUDIX domain-containing protein [Treponema sp.]MBQ1727537.1 NUDIX domain-containing protein [Treponema sp.]MBQ1795528.1 NUDIX domain-containing protein [Treponema sp.]MBQ2207023.1 NUDIX domain-containing protein [Treponema sp.]
MAGTSITGIALDGDRVLVAKRNPVGQMGGRWEFPGGKVESGESDADAVVREFKEEFGVKVKVFSNIANAHFVHNGQTVALHAYLIKVPHKGIIFKYKLSEHSEYRWVRIDDVKKLNFVDSDLLLYPEVRKFVYEKGAK